jgi:hypothetical protein
MSRRIIASRTAWPSEPSPQARSSQSAKLLKELAAGDAHARRQRSEPRIG